MCGLHRYGKLNDRSNDTTIFRSERTLPEDSKIDYIIYFCFVLNFIDTWLKALENYFAQRRCTYQEKKKELFGKYVLQNQTQLLKASKENTN